jgi:hypothetical protein
MPGRHRQHTGGDFAFKANPAARAGRGYFAQPDQLPTPRFAKLVFVPISESGETGAVGVGLRLGTDIDKAARQFWKRLRPTFRSKSAVIANRYLLRERPGEIRR